MKIYLISLKSFLLVQTTQKSQIQSFINSASKSNLIFTYVKLQYIYIWCFQLLRFFSFLLWFKVGVFFFKNKINLFDLLLAEYKTWIEMPYSTYVADIMKYTERNWMKLNFYILSFTSTFMNEWNFDINKVIKFDRSTYIFKC